MRESVALGSPWVRRFVALISLVFGWLVSSKPKAGTPQGQSEACTVAWNAELGGRELLIKPECF